jgi:hypothetical protein
VPTISIKINGLQALNDGQILGGAKLNGANLAMMGEDGNRALMAKKAALLMRGGGEMEMEGKRMILLQPSNGAGMTKGALGSSGAGGGAVGAKSAVATNAAMSGAPAATANSGAAAAKSASAAAASAKGMGWNLALGGFGPWLVLGSLGIAAVGLYFYLRAERMAMEAAANESPFDELEDH